MAENQKSFFALFFKHFQRCYADQNCGLKRSNISPNFFMSQTF